MKGWTCTVLGIVVSTAAQSAAAGAAVQPLSHAPKQGERVVKDRLHARNNRDQEDDSFLNGVGAVWPAAIGNAAAGYMASTGFLIDRCHVLTNMHTVYVDDLVIDPEIGEPVSFAVGQTEGYGNRGALQGLKFLLTGVVIAHGDAVIVGHVVHNPENDWALIRLEANVDDAIKPLTLAAVDIARLTKDRRLSIAGFPADLRTMRRDRLQFKDLWGSDGVVVRVIQMSTAGALIESTIQAARGSSGSPLYGDFDGLRHLVIGMHQGIRGDGTDASEELPNIQILFTTPALIRIRAAQDRRPCA